MAATSPCPSAPAPIDPQAAQVVWDSALCAQIDPELFFPEQGEWATTETAKGICARCPVQQTCLTTFGPALSHGVVGGHTAAERRRDNTDQRPEWAERRSA